MNVCPGTFFCLILGLAARWVCAESNTNLHLASSLTRPLEPLTASAFKKPLRNKIYLGAQNIIMNITSIARALLILFGAISMFHLLALAGFMPMDKLWGGRLQDQEQLVVMETVSMIVNLIAMAIVALRAGFIGHWQNSLYVRIALWVFCGLFALNTVGNLLATSLFEKIMASVTLFLAYDSSVWPG